MNYKSSSKSASLYLRLCTGFRGEGHLFGALAAILIAFVHSKKENKLEIV